MKTMIRLMLVFIMMLIAAPAYASEATQMWKCGLEEGVTEAKVLAHAKEWLKAARTMKGGEKLEATVFFPVAVNAIGDADLWFVLTAPSFEEWGKFWDGYEGSPAAELDNAGELISCPDSALWESIPIK